MTLTTNEAFQNVERVVEFAEDNIETLTDVDLVTADAYDDSIRAEKHIQKVTAELEKTAENAPVGDAPVFGDMPENTYTKKLTLSEDVATVTDGRAHKFYDDDDMDEYLDYDMFDFIYGLVTDTWPKPKNPLEPRRLRKFMYTGSDDYILTDSNKGVGQVTTEGDGTIVVSSDQVSDFDDIKEICELYKFRYEGPSPKRSPLSRWNFNFKIFVPMTSDYYPMMVEDYFETIGLTLADVMPADFVAQYSKRTKKDLDTADVPLNNAEVERIVSDYASRIARGRITHEHALKEIQSELRRRQIKCSKSKLENDLKVATIFEKFVGKAANSNDSLIGFINDMFAEMEASGLVFSRPVLQQDFLREFEDDFDYED